MFWILGFVICLLVFALMEFVAWFTHKYLMHGWLWSWHESHHVDHDDTFELNDLFGLVFAIPAVACFWFGRQPGLELLTWVGLGMTLYGLVYVVFHDLLVHRRIPWLPIPRKGYLKRVYQAHRLHHAVQTKEGAVGFGFVIAPPVKALQKELKRKSATSS